MAAKKTKQNYITVTSGNMSFGGTSRQVNKMLESDLKAAIKNASSRVAKENRLSSAKREKLSDQRLDKLDAKRKNKKTKQAKTATPSSIKTKEGKFLITKTKTGKTKITNPQGKTVTVPKGTSVAKIAFRTGGAGLGGMFGVKNR